MPSENEIEKRFWEELKDSPFVMLGLEGAREGHTQPMTAQFDREEGPIWFFTSRDNSLVEALDQSHRAIATYTAKGHDLFASIGGALSLDTDRATVDRLWNSQVSAWYDGKDDPRLALLRFNTENAKIWLAGTGSFGAAVKRLIGKDPKDSYQDNVAEVEL